MPEACAADGACAVIKPGVTIKIGMGAPMTGDNAAFGQDISQAAKIAVADAGNFDGFTFELLAEDDGGTPEGGAAVANKFVADPTVVAIAGHIFSGATLAAMPIYEAANIPMMSPSATNPPLTAQRLEGLQPLRVHRRRAGQVRRHLPVQQPQDHEARDRARRPGLRPGAGPGCER